MWPPGNKAESYGGTISFTLGHMEYNSLGLGNQVSLHTRAQLWPDTSCDC